jgi:two-component system response regulator YesN
MIYKVLVVDDEPYIVNWISQMLLASTKYNFKVYKADSAKKALNILEEYAIDILMTDIKMPGISGVELSKIVRKRWPECKMIFISAYSDFEYAKEALSSGVVEYILKTQEDEEIFEAVDKCIDLLEKDKMSKKLLEKADMSIKSLIPYYRLRTLQVMYNMNLELEPEIIRERFDEIKIDIDPRRGFFALICRFDTVKADDFLSVQNNISKCITIQDIIDKNVKDKMNTSAFLMHESEKQSIYIILQEKHGFEGKCREYIEENIHNVQTTIKTIMNIETSFAFSQEKTDFKTWKDTFTKLKTLLDSHYNEKNIVLFDTNNADKKRGKKVNFEISISRLRENIISGNYNNCSKILDDFEQHDEQKVQYFYNNTILLISYILNNAVSKNETTRFKEYSEFNNSKEAYLYLKKEISYLCDSIGKINQYSKVDLINRIKEYIKNNITENFSLESMAEEMYYNPSYLSRIFHNETGITLKSYVDNVKIEKIKELLSNKDIMVKDISEKTGFISATYFSQYFKKHTGLTPNEFRRKLS